MNLFKLIYIDLTILHVILTLKIVSFSGYQTSKREIRFTKVESKFLNNFSGIVLENNFRQLGNSQTIFIHLILNEKVTDFSTKFVIYKCKEYYIDCVNVVSFDILNGCSKLNLITYFQLVNDLEDNLKKCPAFGEYKYRNISIDADKFMSSFSNPTEKWWEYYWKMKISFYNESKLEFFRTTGEFYFIQFRIRNRKS